MWPHLEIPLLGYSGPTHAFVLIVAVLTGNILVTVTARHFDGLPAKRVLAGAVLLGLAALVGARAHYVVLRLHWFRLFPASIFELRYAGYHAFGGLVGVLVAAPLISRALHLPFGKWIDASLAAGAVSIVIARIGCLLNGCCFGTPCSYFWCLHYPAASGPYFAHLELGIIDEHALTSAPVHPIALYFAAAAAFVACLAYLRYPTRRFDGEIGLYGTAALTLTTVAIELLRNQLPFDVSWWNVDQRLWLSAAACAALAFAIAARERHWFSARRATGSVSGGVRHVDPIR